MAQEPTYDIASFTGLTLNPETITENVQTINPVTNEQAGIEPVSNSTTNENATNTTNPIIENNTKKAENENGHLLSLRALVTIRDAGVIIGKGGKNVTEVREITGVRAAVSKVVQGVNERVLTVTGNLDSVAKAYSLFARYLLENSNNTNSSSNNVYNNNFSFVNHFTNNNNHNNNNNNTSNNNEQITAVHLLIYHLLLGSIIGKFGVKIKEIQEASGARIVASKEMLPQSTERVIDIIGTVDAIQIAVYQIGECILNDIEKNSSCIQYNPTIRNNITTAFGHSYRNFDHSYDHGNNNYDYHQNHNNNNGSNGQNNQNNNGDKRKNMMNNKNKSGEIEVRKINVPADMVGCIIGRGGKKITEIRNISGSKINISAVDSNKSSNSEREFTITGTPENIDQALFLLYAQLDQEKQRRLNNEKNKNQINNNNNSNPNANTSNDNANDTTTAPSAAANSINNSNTSTGTTTTAAPNSSA